MRRVWRAIALNDWIVLGSALLVAGLGIGVQWLQLELDPEGENRSRYYFEFTEGHGLSRRQPRALWNDAEDALLPAGFPYHLVRVGGVLTTPDRLPAWSDSKPLGEGAGGHPGEPARGQRRAVVYRSAPDRGTDLWASRWFLVVQVTEAEGKHYPGRHFVYSPGPDRQFEWGEGDDLLVDPARTYPVVKVRPWLILAGLLLLPYLSFRLWRQPRSPALWVELVRTTVIAIPFAAVIGELSSSGSLRKLLEETGDQLLVTPRTAIFITGLLVTWGFILFTRLRKERDAEGETLGREVDRSPDAGA